MGGAIGILMLFALFAAAVVMENLKEDRDK
jgi:hypothetical protein